jgi:hypothetical protein
LNAAVSVEVWFELMFFTETFTGPTTVPEPVGDVSRAAGVSTRIWL